MRVVLSIIFIVLILILGVCSFFSFKSRKQIGKSVAILMIALIPPVLGNLFIISSPYEILSTIGCYIYFLGMDLVMVAMIRFTFDYCGINFHNRLIKTILYVILALDAVQLLINIGTGHAFYLELTQAYGADYWKFIPLWGQTVHRVVDYSILGAILIFFIVKTILTPKLYMEKYLVILLAMIAVSAWQTFYIFSGTPVDISMTGFGVFGVLVFLLALYYRPLRLMDRMLAAIASKMPEAIIFLDRHDKAIWINNKASELMGIEVGDLDQVQNKLNERLGDFEKEGNEWKSSSIKGDGENITSYAIEKHAVIDDKGRRVGAYLIIRDNSDEQKTIQRETYNAHHDALTNAYNRAGFDAIIEDADLNKVFLVLLDGDSFKSINDKYGHSIGDKALIRLTDSISSHFRDDDYVCRIGGDEFAVIMENVSQEMINTVGERIKNINRELTKLARDLPPMTISAGGAYGKDAENIEELFNNADHALYQTKFNGKCGFTLFKQR